MVKVALKGPNINLWQRRQTAHGVVIGGGRRAGLMSRRHSSRRGCPLQSGRGQLGLILHRPRPGPGVCSGTPPLTERICCASSSRGIRLRSRAMGPGPT